jgi:hypothetical protein
MPKITATNTIDRRDVAGMFDPDVEDDEFAELGAPIRTAEPRTLLRETRDADVRLDRIREVVEDDSWMSPSNLQSTPPPRPGMSQRWIRFDMRGEQDMLNWNRKFRMGWQARDPATLPSSWRHLPKHRANGQGADMITVGGMVLCEAPVAFVKRYREVVAEKQARLTKSVSHDTDTASREGAKMGAPPIVREEELTSTRGRQPSTLAE